MKIFHLPSGTALCQKPMLVSEVVKVPEKHDLPHQYFSLADSSSKWHPYHGIITMPFESRYMLALTMPNGMIIYQYWSNRDMLQSLRENILDWIEKNTIDN